MGLAITTQRPPWTVGRPTPAPWKGGELLAKMEKDKGGRPEKRRPLWTQFRPTPVTWKGGELLAKVERSQGNRTDLQLSSTVDGSSYARTLEAAKLSESTAKRWQRNSAIGAFLTFDEPDSSLGFFPVLGKTHRHQATLPWGADIAPHRR